MKKSLLCLLLACLLTFGGCVSFGDPKETDTGDSVETSEETTGVLDESMMLYDSIHLTRRILNILGASSSGHAIRFFEGGSIFKNHIVKGDSIVDIVEHTPAFYAVLSEDSEQALRVFRIEDGVTSPSDQYDAARLFFRYWLSYEEIFAVAPATKELPELSVSGVFCYMDTLGELEYVQIHFLTNRGTYVLINQYEAGDVNDPRPEDQNQAFPLYLLPQSAFMSLAQAVKANWRGGSDGEAPLGIEDCGYDLTPYVVEWTAAE